MIVFSRPIRCRLMTLFALLAQLSESISRTKLQQASVAVVLCYHCPRSRSQHRVEMKAENLALLRSSWYMGLVFASKTQDRLTSIIGPSAAVLLSGSHSRPSKGERVLDTIAASPVCCCACTIIVSQVTPIVDYGRKAWSLKDAPPSSQWIRGTVAMHRSVLCTICPVSRYISKDDALDLLPRF